jgi:leucyl aminopeptidase (aminopeptidase T)
VMIGSSEMDVDGVFADGSSEPLMRKGQFVFEQWVQGFKEDV